MDLPLIGNLKYLHSRFPPENKTLRIFSCIILIKSRLWEIDFVEISLRKLCWTTGLVYFIFIESLWTLQRNVFFSLLWPSKGNLEPNPWPTPRSYADILLCANLTLEFIILFIFFLFTDFVNYWLTPFTLNKIEYVISNPWWNKHYIKKIMNESSSAKSLNSISVSVNVYAYKTLLNIYVI